jgi:hypothetical protein
VNNHNPYIGHNSAIWYPHSDCQDIKCILLEKSDWNWTEKVEEWQQKLFLLTEVVLSLVV